MCGRDRLEKPMTEFQYVDILLAEDTVTDAEMPMRAVRERR